MDKIIAFSNQTEARDKFTKAIQYTAKLISWSLMKLKFGKAYQKRFYDLYLMARDSRKIFRLFKSISEIKTIIHKINELLYKQEKVTLVFEILSRISYLIQYIFDNIFILASLRIIVTNDLNYFSKISHTGWVVGLLWDLIKNIYELLILILNKFLKTSKDYNILKPNKEIFKKLITIFGKLSDLIPASSGTNIPEMIIGLHFNDGIVGLFGIFSSLVSVWNLWNQF